MDFPFSLRGCDGRVAVDLRANAAPEALGCDFLTLGAPANLALGYPVCTATINYDRDGYAAVFGWTQLVCSTDNASAGERFKMDPIAVYGDLNTPFAWFGLKPTLFDAPFRFSRDDLDWTCHSFLCVLSDAVMTREVQAVLGFAWGFTIRDGEISLDAPIQLGTVDWDQHLPVLVAHHPGWTFQEGFA